MQIASQTIASIERALVADQGDRFRGLLRKNMAAVSDAYESDTSAKRGFRRHLGASLLGGGCSRAIWYSFRWATQVKHGGRMLRLFNRGHLEEARFVSLLEMIGCEVHQFEPDGQQYRLKNHGGHFGGGLDCVVVGLPDLPLIPVLGEFKTHNDASFTKLKRDGVIATKYQHYVQMTMYLGAFCLSHAIYMAVNKDTDELYAEIVEYNHELYLANLDKALKIIQSPTPPKRIARSPTMYGCKFCDFSPVCHSGAELDRNCRTCEHVRPLTDGDGAWFCDRYSVELEKKLMLTGCTDYSANRLFGA